MSKVATIFCPKFYIPNFINSLKNEVILMKRMFFMGIILALSLLIVACQQQLVCKTPYIPFGNSCCLDANANHICDSKEQVAGGTPSQGQVTTPQTQFSSMCTLPSGIACIDNRVTTAGLALILQNSMGYTITIDSISFSGTQCSDTPDQTVYNGAQATIALLCPIDEGTFNSTMTLIFTRLGTGIKQTFNGNLWVRSVEVSPPVDVSPTKFLDVHCTLPSGIACMDFKATPDYVIIIFQNSFGYPIQIKSINLPDVGCNVNQDTTLQSGEPATFTIAPCRSTGQRLTSKLDVTFVRSDTGVTQTVSGELDAIVS